MSTPFRIAFLGVDNPHGAGWRELMSNFQSEAEIVAFVPGFGGATASLEERYADAPRFDSVAALVEWGEFDGAMVCLPNNEAPQAMVQLAAAGKHVLAEKPGAGSPHDLDAVVEAVQQAGVAFQCGYMWRYDEAANRLKDMVRDGRFGKLISLEMTFVTSDVRRRNPSHYLFDRGISGGGFFNWLACHYLDLLLYVTGQRVVGVTARTGVFGETPVEVEDGGVAVFDLADGSMATFLGGYWLPRWAGESHWCLRGSQRWVHWDPSRSGTGGVLEIHGPQPQWHAMEETFVLPEDTTAGYGGGRGLALVRDWLDAARSSSGSSDSASGSSRVACACRNTPGSMRAALQLIEVIYQASREGRRIECSIPPG